MNDLTPEQEAAIKAQIVRDWGGQTLFIPKGQTRDLVSLRIVLAVFGVCLAPFFQVSQRSGTWHIACRIGCEVELLRRPGKAEPVSPSHASAQCSVRAVGSGDL